MNGVTSRDSGLLMAKAILSRRSHDGEDNGIRRTLRVNCRPLDSGDIFGCFAVSNSRRRANRCPAKIARLKAYHIWPAGRWQTPRSYLEDTCVPSSRVVLVLVGTPIGAAARRRSDWRVRPASRMMPPRRRIPARLKSKVTFLIDLSELTTPAATRSDSAASCCSGSRGGHLLVRVAEFLLFAVSGGFTFSRSDYFFFVAEVTLPKPRRAETRKIHAGSTTALFSVDNKRSLLSRRLGEFL